MHQGCKLGIALLIAMASGPASSQSEMQQATLIDENAAAFLLDSMRVKSALRREQPSHRALADRFWASAVTFVEIVTSARDEQQLYTPILGSLQTAVKEQVKEGTAIDVVAIQKIEASLAEQVKVASGLGIFPGGPRGRDIEIRAIDQTGREIDGLYVWLDLLCCVRQIGSANALPTATSPTKARIIPGTYLVRLVQNDRAVSQREVTLGTSLQSPERVDIVVPK